MSGRLPEWSEDRRDQQDHSRKKKKGEGEAATVPPGGGVFFGEIEDEEKADEDGDGKFPVAGKNVRGEEADKDAADGSAESDAEIEGGKELRSGADARGFAVTEHAAEEEKRGVGGDLEDEGNVCIWKRDENDAGGGEREGGLDEIGAVPAVAFEAEDEGEEIEAERKNPEEGDYGNLLADEIGGGHEEGGGGGCEEDPLRGEFCAERGQR